MPGPIADSDSGTERDARTESPQDILPPSAEPPLIAEPKSGRPWGFWATIGLALGILLASVATQAVVLGVWLLATGTARRGMLPKDLDSNGLFLALATCASAPVVIGLAYLFAWIRTRAHAGLYLGFRRVPGKVILRWSIALLGLILISDTFTAVLGRPVVPSFMDKAYATAGFLPLLWLALLVAAPLAEETLFRGFLFEGLRHSGLGPIGAVTFSSVWWASIHVQYDRFGMASIFVLGLFLGWVRLRTQSVVVTMYLHGLANLIATIEVALKVS